MLRSLSRLVLVLFLLWHMFAVAVYSVPRAANDDVAVFTKRVLIPAVSPYMFFTSQWQLWNIFSPDPLRRVTAYHIEQEQTGVWKALETIEPDAFSPFRHAPRMKMMGNLISEFDNNRAPFAGRLMQLACATYGVPSGTRVRLVYRVYVLPYLTRPQTAAWWSAWKPDIEEHTGFVTSCL